MMGDDGYPMKIKAVVRCAWCGAKLNWIGNYKKHICPARKRAFI